MFSVSIYNTIQVNHLVRKSKSFIRKFRFLSLSIHKVHHFIVENPFHRICSAYSFLLSTSSSHSAYLRFRPWSFPVNALENWQSLLRSSPYLSIILQSFQPVLFSLLPIHCWNTRWCLSTFLQYLRDLRFKWLAVEQHGFLYILTLLYRL